MSTAKKVNRGDVVLLPITFVSGSGSKIRPALIVQNNRLNRQLNSTIVAAITTTNARAKTEPSQLFVDISTPDGRQTGLIFDSTVKTEHLVTVDRRDIVRLVGTFSTNQMQQIDACLKSALEVT